MLLIFVSSLPARELPVGKSYKLQEIKSAFVACRQVTAHSECHLRIHGSKQFHQNDFIFPKVERDLYISLMTFLDIL